LGGGTLRDLLIDRRPFFWVSHQEYLLVIVPLCVAFVYSRAFHSRVRQWHGQAVLVDAMGLALFTLTGVGFALHRGLPPFVASLIGVVTGTFGGVLRDVMSMEIPVIFRPGELYAVSLEGALRRVLQVASNLTLHDVAGAWKIARRTIVLDQNVLLAKNMSIFFAPRRQRVSGNC